MSQTIENNNSWIIIKDYNFDPSEYDHWTEWSDFNTFVPALFLMLHGFELVMKGLLIWSGNSIIKSHNAAFMLKELEVIQKIDRELLAILSKYIGSNIKSEVLKRFLSLNSQLSSDNLHVDIRYPESKGRTVDFMPMKFREDEIIEELKEIVCDIDLVLKKSIKMTKGN